MQSAGINQIDTRIHVAINSVFYREHSAGQLLEGLGSSCIQEKLCLVSKDDSILCALELVESESLYKCHCNVRGPCANFLVGGRCVYYNMNQRTSSGP